MEFTDQPLQAFGETILDMAVPTNLSYKTPLVFRMVKELKEHEYLPWTGSTRAELCFDEALTNCMMHGNDLDPEKKVRVTLFGDAERWGLILEDEGKGFGREDVPDVNGEEALLHEAGRGIMLMDSFLDELKYNPQGNRLMMVRARQKEPDALDAMAAMETDGAASVSSERIEVTVVGDIQVVEVHAARVDDGNVAEIREELAEVVDEGAEIVLDLSRVEYISSVGIGALVSVYKRVRVKEGHLVLCALQAGVEEILQSASLLKLFHTAPFRDQAITALRKLMK